MEKTCIWNKKMNIIIIIALKTDPDPQEVCSGIEECFSICELKSQNRSSRNRNRNEYVVMLA
jgi:hypothetical protein